MIPVVTLDRLYDALNVRTTYSDVWWAEQDRWVERLGFSLYRLTEWGIAEFFGTVLRTGEKVFR